MKYLTKVSGAEMHYGPAPSHAANDCRESFSLKKRAHPVMVLRLTDMHKNAQVLLSMPMLMRILMPMPML